MPSKNTSVIAARVKDDIAVKIGEIAQNKGISIAKLIEEMTENYESEKGVTPYGYADCFAQRIDDRLKDLRERNYPESFIEKMKGQIVNGLDSQISMLPKEYDPRRSRSYDSGC